eukprot:1247315-Rhodomonas_salina.1
MNNSSTILLPLLEALKNYAVRALDRRKFPRFDRRKRFHVANATTPGAQPESSPVVENQTPTATQ